MKCKLNLELEDDSITELRICFVKKGEAIVQPVYTQMIPMGNMPANQDVTPAVSQSESSDLSVTPKEQPKDDIPPEMMMEF